MLPDEAGQPERPGPFGRGECNARRSEQGEAGDDGDLRSPARAAARRECRPALRRRRRPRRAVRRRSSRARTRPRSRESSGASAPNSIASTNTTDGHENEEADASADVTGESHWPTTKRKPSGPRPMRRAPIRRTQLQGSWRETGSPSGVPFHDCATNKFSEPGALSSSTPTNFRLAAYGLPEWTRPSRVPCSLQGGI